ncbi:MAG: ribonuclease III [Acidobacteriota bacterium]|nr:ribonuclease III [Acidobacteriota bacterium]
MKALDLSPLEATLGHSFLRRELLEQALTHSSHAHESDPIPDDDRPAPQRDNEQLEFLGDAVLGFVTSQALVERYPNYNEGKLSKLRAHLVSARHLQSVALELGLGKYLRLGHGEERSGGRHKAALLVNALEALLAALYLDAGLDAPRRFILAHIVEPELARLGGEATEAFPVTDHKSALQELLQARGRPQPVYALVKEEGPEHQKTFTVEIRVIAQDEARKEFRARASASTKKAAEQIAARKALEKLAPASK